MSLGVFDQTLAGGGGGEVGIDQGTESTEGEGRWRFHDGRVARRRGRRKAVDLGSLDKEVRYILCGNIR